MLYLMHFSHDYTGNDNPMMTVQAGRASTYRPMDDYGNIIVCADEEGGYVHEWRRRLRGARLVWEWG